MHVNSNGRFRLRPAFWVLIIAGLVAGGFARAEFWNLQGAVRAHDPSIIHDGTGWWVFSTGVGLPVKYSADGLTWKQSGTLFSTEKPWWRAHARAMRANQIWAPDVRRFGDRYWCFYCVSEFGKNNSAIGLISCSSIAKGDWRDDGVVITSKEGATAYNAIDPNLAVDAVGNPWLVFGSWFGGIQLVALGPTMKPMGPIHHLAARAGGIEAPSIVFANGFYYLFVSIDKCCMGVDSTYKIACGRSTLITGPYVNRKGIPMTKGASFVLDAGNARWKGPGGQNVYQRGDGWIIVRHVYDAENNGTATLLISDLYWDAEKWPRY